METFGARVRVARDAKGWTQEELARAVGARPDGKPYVYSGVVISRWEKGHGSPHDPDVIVRVCDALGVSADWLLRGLGDPPASAADADADPPLETACEVA